MFRQRFASQPCRHTRHSPTTFIQRARHVHGIVGFGHCDGGVFGLLVVIEGRLEILSTFIAETRVAEVRVQCIERLAVGGDVLIQRLAHRGSADGEFLFGPPPGDPHRATGSDTGQAQNDQQWPDVGGTASTAGARGTGAREVPSGTTSGDGIHKRQDGGRRVAGVFQVGLIGQVTDRAHSGTGLETEVRVGSADEHCVGAGAARGAAEPVEGNVRVVVGRGQSGCG